MARAPRAQKPPETPSYSRVLGRHAALLNDPKVRSWWESRSLRSQLSADTYARQFGFLLEKLDLDPPSVVELARSNPDALRDRLVRYAATMKREGRLDSYIAKFFEGLKSYFRFHRVAFDGFPSLSPIRGESLRDERVPTPEELAPILERLSLRSRVCALFMAHAGLRPGVLGSYQAQAGLTLGDLPDLDLEALTLAEVPFVIRVPGALSKTRSAYTTFGTAQLASSLLAYLRERSESGEALTPSSPVVAVRATRGVAERRRTDRRYARGFVVTKAVVEEIHDALAEAAPRGTRWRPYVLRSYCSTRLLMAEGAGKMTRDLREALLGHDLGISGRYTLGKRWGDDLLREARAAYGRAAPYLETNASATNTDRDLVTRRVVLRMHGYTEEEVAKMDIASKTDDELIALADAKRLENQRAAAPTPRPLSQRVARMADAEALISEGWEYVAPLGAEKVILRFASP